MLPVIFSRAYAVTLSRPLKLSEAQFSLSKMLLIIHPMLQGSNCKSQCSKETPQFIHPRDHAAQGCTYTTFTAHIRGMSFAIEGWQLLQSGHARQQSPVEIMLINDRVAVQRVRHMDRELEKE